MGFWRVASSYRSGGRYPKRIRADAYNYASGGPISFEIDLLNNIDRFGAQAVMGRPLYLQEMRGMRAAENVVRAYASRENYKDKDGLPNWPEWMSKHPKLSCILNAAEEQANG